MRAEAEAVQVLMSFVSARTFIVNQKNALGEKHSKILIHILSAIRDVPKVSLEDSVLSWSKEAGIESTLRKEVTFNDWSSMLSNHGATLRKIDRLLEELEESRKSPPPRLGLIGRSALS